MDLLLIKQISKLIEMTIGFNGLEEIKMYIDIYIYKVYIHTDRQTCIHTYIHGGETISSG